MKGKIFIITTIVFFVGLIVGGYFIFDFSSKNKELSLENQKLERELEDTDEELEESQDQVDILEEEKSTLSKENADLLAQFDTLQEEYDFLVDFTYCNDDLSKGIEIDYSSVETVSQSLIDWMEGWEGTVEITEATWRIFWLGFGISIHNLYYSDGSGNIYLNAFLVFFETDDHIGGVYYVYEQCWLDIQE